MERVKKVIFIIAILGIICVILILGGSILKEKINSRNDWEEFNISRKLIIGTWVCEKRENKNYCIKTLSINDNDEFVFDCIKEDYNMQQIKYNITGKCHCFDYKDKLYKKYRFDREFYKNILNASEKMYNWKDYLDEDAPIATIKNETLELLGEIYIRKE